MPPATRHRRRRLVGSAPRRGSTTWLVIGGLLTVVVLGASTGLFYKLRSKVKGVQPQSYKVERGPFAFYVTERGEIESSNNVEIRCEVKSLNSGGTAIIEVVPEGRMVHAGDVLVRLDSSALEHDLVQQQIVCNSSEAAMIFSRNAYEAALISKTEYIEGAYRQEEQTVLNEIFVAEEDMRRAEQYLLHSEQLAARGYVTALQLEGDRFAVAKSQGELEAAQTKLHVLQEYTLQKKIKELESEIVSSQAAWKAEENSYQLELDNLHKIEEQIALCTIRAPQAGQVVHANEFDRRGNGEIVIEPGTLVRERQVIIRLPDPERMQVKADISESRIAYVQARMSADIQVDAFNGMLLEGAVLKVNEYPEPSGWLSSAVKKYATIVEIHDPPPTLRPGLTAQVKIHVERLDDVLTVPVQAILERRGWYYCLVRQGLDWVPQRVTIGPTNDKQVIIETGLSEGDEVALNPRRYVDEDKLPGGTVPERSNGRSIRGELKQADAESAGQPSPSGDSPDQQADSAAGEGAVAESVGDSFRGGRGDPATMASAMFSRMDANSDGLLSGDELPAERREQIMAADTNSDGAISRDELTAGMRAMRGGGRTGGGSPRE